MDIKELKKLINNSTSVLVLDEGEPSFVILDYKMYKDLAGEREEREIKINHPGGKSDSNGRNHYERETEILDRLNKEIMALKTQIEMEERGMASHNNPHID